MRADTSVPGACTSPSSCYRPRKQKLVSTPGPPPPGSRTDWNFLLLDFHCLLIVVSYSKVPILLKRQLLPFFSGLYTRIRCFVSIIYTMPYTIAGCLPHHPISSFIASSHHSSPLQTAVPFPGLTHKSRRTLNRLSSRKLPSASILTAPAPSESLSNFHRLWHRRIYFPRPLGCSSVSIDLCEVHLR